MNCYSAGPENLEGMESNVIDRIHDLVARVIMNSTYIVRKKALVDRSELLRIRHVPTLVEGPTSPIYLL